MSYDRWKLATAPHFDEGGYCPKCGEPITWVHAEPVCLVPSGECDRCQLPLEDHLTNEEGTCDEYQPDAHGCGWPEVQ